MTEITQADRDAAGSLRPILARFYAEGGFDHCKDVKTFASHRMAERAAIVAWLRTQDDPNEKWALQNSHWYAAEIEAGAHTQ